MFSCSHQSTFDRLYDREKKLYQEVRVDEVEDVMTTEKMAEIPMKVLCAGMSVANSSLTEFAIGSAEGYAEYVK
ncbi:hypothetical protein NC651_039176 [Populus alba x Populus x berolinensis]|nr:hypothetical protein NC651_039176 [Populus alba x Populus x berolinensis]